MLDTHAAYTDYAEQLRCYIVRHIGPGQDADDLAGALWLEVVRRADAYEDRGHPVSSWLYRVARSRIIDYQRRRARRAGRTIPLHDGILSDDPRPPVEAALDAGQTWALLAVLTPRQRHVIALRFLADCTIIETAEKLEMSYGAVKALQNRGIARLRRMYAE